MFKLLRYYSMASLLAVLATAALLTWFYRHVAIRGIIELAEHSNLNLAQLAMNPMRPALLTFLDAAADLRPGSASPPMPAELARSITAVMRDEPFIVKIKVYNRQGTVVFSTVPSQVGDDQSRNGGFIAAIRGSVASELVYRDTFNSFDGVTEEDNLIQTYLPVRAGPAEPIRGVFELYGDVNKLVHQTERTQFIVMGGAILVLSILYTVLILVVRHASGIIEQQQRTIRERTETLELLSAHMLKTEESHKQKIAFELHEGVAQTLAAVKLKAETRNDRSAGGEAAAPVDSMIPMLQEAIDEVRAIATDLRPASLDDLGLLPTIYWLCREFEKRHPGIRVERRISLQERDVPAPLKGILYRIIMSVLGDMAQRPDARGVQLALELAGNDLILLIDDTPEGWPANAGAPEAEPQLRSGFARMEELTTLSGGTFTATQHPGGGATLRAAWDR